MVLDTLSCSAVRICLFCSYATSDVILTVINIANAVFYKAGAQLQVSSLVSPTCTPSDKPLERSVSTLSCPRHRLQTHMYRSASLGHTRGSFCIWTDSRPLKPHPSDLDHVSTTDHSPLPLAILFLSWLSWTNRAYLLIQAHLRRSVLTRS